MKKVLLSFVAFTFCISAVNAQHRVLFEEFTGSNCPPCAATNPTLDMLILGTPANLSKVQMVRYQAPVAGQGAIYLENTTDVDSRMNYYRPQASIVGPSARLDGKVLGPSSDAWPQHAAHMSQTAIDTQSAKDVPFTVEVTNFKWLNSDDSIEVEIQVTANEAHTGFSNLMIGLLQDLHYTAAPGSNGEKSFERVLRKFYPNSLGVSMQSSWAINETKTFTYQFEIPSHVKAKDLGMIATWIENRGQHEVLSGVARSRGDVWPNSVPRVDNRISDVILYPNPATNNQTQILATLGASGNVKVVVTNAMGQVVSTTQDQYYSKGTHDIDINTQNLAAGYYNVTLKTNQGSVTQRLIIAK